MAADEIISMENEKHIGKELYIFILWEKARSREEEILSDLKENFHVIQTLDIKWDKKVFSDNLSKFYGKNLPPNCHKEKEVGTGNFLLVLLEDETPLYRIRRTNSGENIINVNIFDTKEMYRAIVRGHNVHSSNTEEETAHDLKLLIGLELSEIKIRLSKGELLQEYKEIL